MAYTIKLGTFQKLENSTAQPVTTGWAEYSIVFKEGAEISYPVITLQADLSTVAPFNYAVWGSRYYWIMSKTMLRSGYCQMELKIDVLATYKSEIGSATLYVLRAAAASDGNIRDNFYPVKANSTKYHQEQTTDIPGMYGTGVVIVNIAGKYTAGATTLWEMTDSAFKTFISELYTDINGWQLNDIIQKVVQYFGGNPQSLINSAMWFPFPFDVYNAEYIKIGGWQSTVIGGVVNDPLYTLGDVTFTLNKHPLAATRGAYLNEAPFTKYNLILPGCGSLELDSSKLVDQTSITIRRVMDAFSGQLFTKVIATQSGQLLAVLNGQIGVSIQLRGSNSANQTINGALSAGAGLVAGAVSANPVALANAALAGIGTAVDSIGGMGTSSSMGSGLAGLCGEPISLDTICYDITNADNVEHGRPLCENRQISGLSGFIQVSEGYVAIPGPLPEQQEVRNFLESGFFYE